MPKTLLKSNAPVTLLGGGAATAADLKTALALAPRLVAADGGAALALETGLMPDAVIGDFDSLSDRSRAQLPPDRLHHIPEQNSTDFDKALRCIAAPAVLAVGFLGRRVDHQLAAFNTLLRHRDRACVLIGQGEIVLHTPPDLRLDMVAGAVVSLFPMRAVTGRSTGLDWPIDGLALAPDGMVSTSNRATGGAMHLQMDGPGLLSILPRAMLGQVTQAIAPDGAPAKAPWPVRA